MHQKRGVFCLPLPGNSRAWHWKGLVGFEVQREEMNFGIVPCLRKNIDLCQPTDQIFVEHLFHWRAGLAVVGVRGTQLLLEHLRLCVQENTLWSGLSK